MKHEPYTLSYSQVHIGTKSTAIEYYENISEVTELLSTVTSNCIFITDETVFSLPKLQPFFSSISKTNLCILPAGEKHKTIDNVLLILKQAVQLELSRSSLFIGIGGGVITDMSAFAASLFKRGAQLWLVPTTLLAMADASIGGKTGCDFDGYKNTIGTFYPASRLLFTPEFLLTLSQKEYLSGLAEVAKTAMLYAPSLFNILCEKKPLIIEREQEILMQIVKRCAKAKAMIVEKDLTESNTRKQLNLGHTFAHALESITGLGTITHGEAVAWGLGRAIELSYKLGYCEEEYKNDVFSLLSKYSWVTDSAHPICKEQNILDAPNKIVQAMRQDKKNNSLGITLILQRDINSTLIETVSETNILSVLS